MAPRLALSFEPRFVSIDVAGSQVGRPGDPITSPGKIGKEARQLGHVCLDGGANRYGPAWSDQHEQASGKGECQSPWVQSGEIDKNLAPIRRGDREAQRADLQPWVGLGLCGLALEPDLATFTRSGGHGRR